MAQSPETFAELATGNDYLKGWGALGALLAQGHSFSGHERNCAFLNIGIPAGDGSRGPSFACASGALNLDQIDDSRSVIAVDWDKDGDLDLWCCNRTAPRLRFLRNDTPPEAHWLALDLEGLTCNRDAIGARVELTLVASDGSRRMLWRRLRAGDGFLSQTPKTVHFGFRPDEKIEKASILWPLPAGPQHLGPLLPDRHYTVREGDAAVEAPRGSPPIQLAVGEPTLPDESDPTRIVPLRRPTVPPLEYFDFRGRRFMLDGPAPAAVATDPKPSGNPTLVLLWASWCAPCLVEMKEIAAHAVELRAAHVRVIALSIDAAKPDATKADVEAAQKAAEGLHWPFEAGVTHEGTLHALALMEARLMYFERPLPLPSAYLIDGTGKLTVLYKGPASTMQVVQDAGLAEHPPAQPETVAFPFPGRSAQSLFNLQPAGFAQAFREGGDLEAARGELQQQIDELAGRSRTDGTVAPILAQAWWGIADLEEAAGHTAEAVAAYQQARALAPRQASLHLAYAATLWRAARKDEATKVFEEVLALAQGAPAVRKQAGKVWQSLGEPARSLEQFAAVLVVTPDDRDAMFNLALSRKQGGDPAGAVTAYEALLARQSDHPEALGNLTWILATSKDPRVRNPARAMKLAARITRPGSGTSPALLDALAAAQAASGDFPQAVKTADLALKGAIARGDASLATDVRKRREGYEAGRAWTE